MSRKFGKEFARARRLPPRKPTHCGRCRKTIPVRASWYPAAGHGDVGQTCRDRLTAEKPRTASCGAAAEAKAAATREQVARLVKLATEREAEVAS